MTTGHAETQQQKREGIELPPEVERWLKIIEAQLAEDTVDTRRSQIKSFHIWCDETGRDMHGVAMHDIEDYLISLDNRGLADATKQIYFYSLNTYYKHAVKRGTVDENPLDDISISDWVDFNSTRKEEALKEDFHYITPEEKELLTDNVKSPGLRNELIIRLLWQTGMRQEELCSIELQDISREDRYIKIRSDKTYENRKVWYQPSLDALLADWIENGRTSYTSHKESDRLFVTPKLPYLREQTANNVIKNAAENAGLQSTMYTDAAGLSRHKVTGHTLRHSFAVQCVKNGMDIRSLQKLMGHKHIKTTARYLKIKDDTLREMSRMYGAGVENTH